jgi:hypothetical protein
MHSRLKGIIKRTWALRVPPPRTESRMHRFEDVVRDAVTGARTIHDEVVSGAGDPGPEEKPRRGRPPGSKNKPKQRAKPRSRRTR